MKTKRPLGRKTYDYSTHGGKQMTDIMKLADDYAEQRHTQGAPVYNAVSARARDALQSTIRALQKEVSTLDVLLEECKMDWSGDVTQIKAEHKHEIEALQSKLGDAIQSSAHWQNQFTDAQAENERLKQDRDEWRDSTIAANANAASEEKRRREMQDQRDQLQSQLDAMGKGEPVAWQFRTNGKHWHVVQVCPPDDAYDKGTLSPLYAAPKALALDVDWLSNVIRQVDGNNKIGASRLPERDTNKPAEEQGLFRKFDVTRTDGSSSPGGKHHDCEYFVLDVDHDPHAKAALQAYSLACASTHPQLSTDLMDRYGGLPQATEPAEKRKLYECTGCGHLYEERPSSCECMENPMKNVIELAKQAGLCLANDEKPLIERFAALVRNAALEEAAQKCRTPHSYFKDNRTNIECALAIESLKEPTP